MHNVPEDTKNTKLEVCFFGSSNDAAATTNSRVDDAYFHRLEHAWLQLSRYDPPLVRACHLRPAFISDNLSFALCWWAFGVRAINGARYCPDVALVPRIEVQSRTEALMTEFDVSSVQNIHHLGLS